jgi:glycosyltransferase involved in cell wall biosynthesis
MLAWKQGKIMAKNICLIVQARYPEDVRVRKEAMALLSKGHKVSVIALLYPDEPKHEIVEGVKVYRVGFPKKRSGTLRYIFEYATFLLLSFFKLNVLDLKENYDVIHINSLPDFLVFSAFVQKIKGRKIVLDMHEIMPEFFMSKFGKGPDHPIIRLLLIVEKISLRFADEVITVNEPIKYIFQSRAIPDKDVTVIMNTVNAAMFKEKKKMDHQGFNCVYHGTLTDMYSLDTAIEGFSKACKNYSSMYFHIFGQGPCLPQLKYLVAELNLQKSVLFHDMLPHEKMLEELSAMDLGILATRKDVFLNLSFSNKLAEYVFLKIPVISSDLDTIKYYFKDDHLLFFEAGRVEDLGRKIEFAYMNRELMQEKAEKACEHFRHFNWDVMAERYVNMIERI